MEACNSVAHIDSLTESAQFLIESLEIDAPDPDPDKLSKVLHTVQTVALNISVKDRELVMLTIRSILFRCVWVSEGGSLEKSRVSIISSLLPLLRTIDKDDNVLEQLIDSLVEKKVNCESWLTILCALSEEIFPDHPILFSKYFWEQIQIGLTHDDNLPRKRALYLMKRTIDTCFSPGCQAEDKSGLIFKDSVQFHRDKTLEGKELFDTYFLIIETLEEKQVHLVKQVLQNLQDLVNVSNHKSGSGPFFHSSWILIAFLRLFKHPSIALVRWGVETFLSTDFDESIIKTENFLSFLCHPLLNILNETKLFGKDVEGNTFSSQTYFPNESRCRITGEVIARSVSKFLNNCLGKVEVDERSKIFRAILNSLTLKSWGPLPLTWFSFALAEMDSSIVPLCLTDFEMKNIRTLVESHMVYQEPLLRGAAQANMLSILLRFLDCQQCTYEELASLLYTMWDKQVLFYSDSENDLWKKASSFIRNNFFNADFENMLSVTNADIADVNSKMSVIRMTERNVLKSILVMLLFLSDADFDPALLKQFKEMFLKNKDFNRPYASSRHDMNEEESTRVEHLIYSSLIKILKGPSRRRGRNFLHFSTENKALDVERTLCILQITEEEVYALIKSLCVSLKICLNKPEVESIFRTELYTVLLSWLLRKNMSPNNYDHELYELFQEAFEVFTQGDRTTKVVALKIIKMFTHLEIGTSLSSQVLKKLQLSFLIPAVTIPLMSESERENDIQNREEQKLWGRLSSEFQRDQLEILKTIVDSSQDFGETQKVKILEKLQDSLEVDGKECLVACLEMALSLGLPCANFLDVTKRFIFEFRKNEIFWPALESFLKLCLENLELAPGLVVTIFLDLILEAENVSGIFPLLIKQLGMFFNTRKCSFNLLVILLPVIAKALTFGPVYRKDQRLVTDTNQVINDLGKECVANYVEGSDHLMDGRVRIDAINMLLKTTKNDNEEAISSAIKTLFTELQKINVETTGKRIRHFENSLIHKVRQRIYQCYVIFAPLLGKTESEQILSELCQELLNHSQQTSVRYYCEWAATIILLKNNQLFSKMWEWLSKAAVEKIGSIPSFLVIITQYLCHCDIENEALEKAIKEISPWCMAQHFATRIVAQICFRKIWKECEIKAFNLVEKYSVLKDCIASSVNPGNSDKISEDFYLTTFDPIEHLTFEDILINFPRLCEISDEELISKPILETIPDSHIPTHNPGSSLIVCSKERPAHVAKHTREAAVNQNVQKKITPWKSMLTDSDLSISNRFSEKSTRAHEDLVVIASLIDKAPNLGGLCRTSEILGVGSLVVHSKTVIKDKEFSSVSVTAENWVPIVECATHKLEEFLGEKKREGFTIVAVEQAKDSIMLQEYKFPKKCVFLLGKEKEGVPVELLNQVDDCIEIPQSGLIRSFNVHVTGALVLWEYVKQHS